MLENNKTNYHIIISLINRKDEDNLNKEITNFTESHLYNESILDNKFVDIYLKDKIIFHRQKNETIKAKATISIWVR